MGKLIVFEGTDGTGKSTQFKLLTERLQREGVDFRKLQFPQYHEPSSALIRMYLDGEFGDNPEDVNAYAASTFYAVDRYASFVKVWRDYYQSGGLMLSDRYTTSNAVHQGGKVPQEHQSAFFQWLYDLEYEKMGLPKPDLVLWMDMPTELAEQLMRRREAENDTKADIHEKDVVYLKQCRATAERAAKHYGWTPVRCHENGQIRPVEAIHEEIYALVKKCLEEA